MGYLVSGIICFIVAAIVVGVLIYFNSEDELNAFGATIGLLSIILFVALGAWLCWAQYNTSSGQRGIKSYHSERAGGLTRTVEVYDDYGHLLKSYKGKLDVETNEAGNKVLFDLNGKRTVVYGAIVVVQEE